ncbi:MAG: response regulator, partial [Gemmatimonadetes bacterium]|nr:response regulator [Gemmatimonadota bacterium]
MKQIAIIDKNQRSIQKLADELKSRGYSVQNYQDEQEALGRLEEDHPDLIISELALRNHTGPEILRELKKLDPAVPVIIISEHSNTQDAIDSMREGAYDYFAKPLDTQKTLAAIEKALARTPSLDAADPATTPDQPFVGGGNRLVGRSPEMMEIYK